MQLSLPRNRGLRGKPVLDFIIILKFGKITIAPCQPHIQLLREDLSIFQIRI